jgi:DNA-binding NtrC family response regulator
MSGLPRPAIIILLAFDGIGRILFMEMNDHILIVDDDRDICQLLTKYLVKNGYHVTSVNDGRQMRAALAIKRIDLIVLDLMLPARTGCRCAGSCATATANSSRS